ncbi:MAG: D-alanyl-D-alanine carboxypeptidase/D-alanyl-D-alanine-endopeptidase [Gammaproteobacteria bacterium]|nr:D-alanyl-D-alanine carboxypeptidase/D-alanyl-D-alanine-endopeptidase [Gammaproteobacteria bacterium]
MIPTWHRPHTLLPGLLLGLALLAAQAKAELPAPVARVASALGVDHGDISLWVQELNRPEPLAAHLPDTPRTPASTMKLVTTFVALQGLTPAFRWRTEVHALGPVVNGVLEGDLLLRGYGDPYLVSEEFWKLTQAIRQRGLIRINGDLVFDTSYYQLPEESPADFDGRPDRVYNLLPHPLLVNFNAMRFEFEPADGQVRVTTEPVLTNVEVQNRLRVAPGACGGYQRGIALNVLEPPVRDRVMLEGAFPAGCSRYAMTRSVLQPESYAFGLFDKYWRQAGGEIRGGWRSGVLPSPWTAGREDLVAANGDDDAQASVDADTLLHVHHSRSLGEIVRLVNKYSNNVMTRHLELTLGAQRFDPPATPEKGRAATLELLRQYGIDTGGLIIDNPSGLSRTARLSARQLGQLLVAAWDGPYMPEFVSSLALSGLDGTVRNRFRFGPEAGRMHLKTGTLDHVSAIAGYVQTPDNRRFAVVVMVNAPQAHRGPGEEIQNALLSWVFNQPPQ